MAGVKGRSGGARANSGPKSKITVPKTDDPLAFLLGVMNDKKASPQLRVRAAIAAATYTKIRQGRVGKREREHDDAVVANAGRFAPSPPPRLVVSNGKKD